MKRNMTFRFGTLAALVVAPAVFQGGLMAQTPQANAIPFVATNPTSPHTSWSGNAVTLKGTLTSSFWGSHSFTYDWNPGDGGTHCTGSVSNEYDIECAHTYTGAVNTLYTAVLTITDTTNSLVSPAANCPPSITQGACYYTSLNAPPPNLSVEVNNAIDNALWFIHKTMVHTTSGYGASIGNWNQNNGNYDDVSQAGDTGPNALYCTAFEVSGFLATTTPANPYSSDVALCLNGILDQLTTRAVSSITPGGFAAFDPDYNGNHYGVEHNGGSANYQTGMMLDSIAASQSPSTIVTSNTNLGHLVSSQSIAGTGAGGAYTYKDAMIDMVDDYSYCMNLGTGYSNEGYGANYDSGGWHYTCQEGVGDNSVSQWAAIGIIPTRRTFYVSGSPSSDPLNAEVLSTDQLWLSDSFTQASTDNGYFGYTSGSPIWGPYADTPSGLVQLAMNGKGRGTTVDGKNMWDSAETFIRDNFGNPASEGAGSSLKDYYYGMFSFTKSMLLHDNSGTGLSPTPITTLQSSDDPGNCASPGVPVTSPGSGTGPCYPAIDWYGAQSSTYGGTDPTDGVARTLVSTQNSAGYWFGHNYNSSQYYFETAAAVIMLNKTVFQPVPVACFTANPNPVSNGGAVTLNASCSLDQNPAYQLVTYEWDVDGTGGTNFTIAPGSPYCQDSSCSIVSYNFRNPGTTFPYTYPIRLRVIDNATPALSADVTGSVTIAFPPNPPSANAGGPYNFCPNTSNGNAIFGPFFLNGSGSTNPDQGTNDGSPGAPLSTIVSYAWDYACSGSFTSASGAQVNVTSVFDQSAYYGSTFNVCLKVTNNDNLAFPTADLSAGLSSVASAQVSIHNPTDEVCSHCVTNIQALVKAPTPSVAGTIQLYWTDTNTSPTFTIDHYNVYRSTSSTFSPYNQIAGAASGGTPAVKVSVPAGGTVYFLDSNVTGGTTYYYRVAPATANDTETCQSAVALAVALPKAR